jgi:hypothetical protein
MIWRNVSALSGVTIPETVIIAFGGIAACGVQSVLIPLGLHMKRSDIEGTDIEGTDEVTTIRRTRLRVFGWWLLGCPFNVRISDLEW